MEGKGGKEREIGVSPKTYARLEKAVANGTRFEFDKDAYRAELKEAAARSGQEYEGSHGLRWSWAQERHAELQEKGLSYDQSLSEVSRFSLDGVQAFWREVIMGITKAKNTY